MSALWQLSFPMYPQIVRWTLDHKRLDYHGHMLPPEFPLRFLAAQPRGLRQWLRRWQAHPGTAWVRRIFAVHRRRLELPV
ncbi:hypothetical protein [Sinimarinibacterium thermocellulolyticum]|uniref:Amidohydrolase n=1 Tax=Sinimarinibacterium thermocellulolyticum TaxID=3170016 RepID=A0ABV2AC37_9GAMM